MGYSASLVASSFRIDRDHHKAALAAVKALLDRPDLMSGKRTQGGRLISQHFAWVDSDKLLAARTLPDAIAEWGWEVEQDDDYNIVDIDFDSEKLGDEDALWAALAPYVATGSHIEMVGEDGERWRWLFRNGRVIHQEPTITWPDDDGRA